MTISKEDAEVLGFPYRKHGTGGHLPVVAQVDCPPKQEPAKKKSTKQEPEKCPKETLVDAEWKPVQSKTWTESFWTLADCFGYFLIHAMIHALVIYMNVMGTVDLIGLVAGITANTAVGTWRVFWRLKK